MRISFVDFFSDQRGHFKIHKYAEEHGLGEPVGLAYFTAHHD